MTYYTDYIINQKQNILATSEDSNPVMVKDIYTNLKDVTIVLSIGGPSYQKIAKELWMEKLTRAKVRACFQDDLYKGFVAAMLWGGLGSNGKSFSHLEKAMVEEKKPTIVANLGRVKKYLDKGDYEIAFKSMCPNGENKIEGVDVSYFTKLLFFMAALPNGSKATPLIYDKWSWHIHAALLLSLGQKEKLFDFFLIKATLKKRSLSNKMAISVFLTESTNKRSKAYLNYIDLMQSQSRSLNKDLVSGNLEQFLFGRARKGKEGKAMDNPRNVLIGYLNEELSKMFKEAEGLINTEEDEKAEKGNSPSQVNVISDTSLLKTTQIELRVVDNTFGCRYPKGWPKPTAVVLETANYSYLAAISTFISTYTIRSKEISRYIKEQGYSEKAIVPAMISVDTDYKVRVQIIEQDVL